MNEYGIKRYRDEKNEQASDTCFYALSTCSKLIKKLRRSDVI